MEWVEILELFEYWDQHPPLHLFVPAALGYKSEKKDVPLPSGQMLTDTLHLRRMPKQVRESNPERDRRFAKLEEMKRNGRFSR